MPKVTGPLFSIGASGAFRGEMEFRQVGDKTVVAGIKTVKPERSAAQQAQSQRFKTAVDEWKLLAEEDKQAWRDASNGTGMTGYQLYISEYQTQNIIPPDQPVIP